MLTSEVYYLKNSPCRGYWWFAIVELGRLGQVVDCITKRPCANYKDAYRLAAEALATERSKSNAA